jgi:hypothetical protein
MSKGLKPAYELSDAEKCDLTQPLFADKREVGLVWNDDCDRLRALAEGVSRG